MPALSKPRRAKSATAASVRAAKPAQRKSAVKAAADSGDFAQQQIARLEAMLEGLIEKANGGELGAVDRILKVLDRLDRYRGFTPSVAPAAPDYDARERILQKLSDVDARRAAAAEEAKNEAAHDASAAV